MPNIFLIGRSSHNWRTNARALALLEALQHSDDFFVPERYDDREPERRPADLSNKAPLCELWMAEVGRLYLRRRHPYPAWLNFKIWPPSVPRFNEVLGGFDERYFRDPAYVGRFIDGIKNLVCCGSFDHICACHESEWHDKTYLARPTKLPSGRIASSGGMWLEEQLPGVFWLNVFGPIYIEFFGNAKFQSLPTDSIHNLPDGSILFLRGPSPFGAETPALKSISEKVIDHLGRTAFFEKSNIKKPPQAPKFLFGRP